MAAKNRVIRIDDETWERWREWAESNGMSVVEMIRECVEDAYHSLDDSLASRHKITTVKFWLDDLDAKIRELGKSLK